MSRSCSARGQNGIGMTTKADGSIRSCAPGRDEKKWSTSVATKCTRVFRETCLRETEKGTHQVRMGGDGQGTTTRRRFRHTRGQSCTRRRRRWRRSTGERGRKVVALVDMRRAYVYAPARRRVFVELPHEDHQPGDEHMCGLLQYSLYGRRDAAQNWEEELASTLSDLKLTRWIACPCVW